MRFVIKIFHPINIDSNFVESFCIVALGVGWGVGGGGGVGWCELYDFSNTNIVRKINLLHTLNSKLH
jgi:hypothetical protein